MLIIGCDYHPSFQQIACVDAESGELTERRLVHREEAERFYQELKQRGLAARVGMEASGQVCAVCSPILRVNERYRDLSTGVRTSSSGYLWKGSKIYSRQRIIPRCKTRFGQKAFQVWSLLSADHRKD